MGKLKLVLFVILDVLTVVLAWLLSAMLLHYDLQACLSENYLYLIGGIAVMLGANLFFGLYSALWAYAGVRDIFKIVASFMFTFAYNCIVSYVADLFAIEWGIIASMFALMMIGATRLFEKIRKFVLDSHVVSSSKNASGLERVLIIGAGEAGLSIIKELQKDEQSKMFPVCVLDDNESKIGKKINGVLVAGKINEVSEIVKKYKIEKIIIAIPSLEKKALNELVTDCKKTKCKVLSVPSMYKLAEGSVTIRDVKEVSVLDLLGREQVKVNTDEIISYIEGKVVLVTGGGGSIGSELCRQIATHAPKQLIIFDVYENNAYDIQQELLRKLPNLNLLVLIGTVREEGKVEDVFKTYRPEIVFHAAAHKHVPLMETSPNEAIKNNVCGTYNVAKMAGEYGAERFILISTDKAVNPTNVMGASKRICEMIVQSINKQYENTDFVAVRFGNVLGSNGSVIPLFTKQIAEGGPITVTHKDIVRYFMTIPEAVNLVLQAGAYAQGGEIFVLNMGEPVRIYDLAVNMIKLSGLEPFKDIDVKITGLRPGEKLYEEMLMNEEGLAKTANDMIFIGHPIEMDEKSLFDTILEMKKLAYEETEKMKEVVHQLVPTYKIDRRIK